MPRKFIDVYDLHDHTEEMKTEVVEIVKEVGVTGVPGTATNVADWAVKDSEVSIPASTPIEVSGTPTVETSSGTQIAVPSTIGELSNGVVDLNLSLDSFSSRFTAQATRVDDLASKVNSSSSSASSKPTLPLLTNTGSDNKLYDGTNLKFTSTLNYSTFGIVDTDDTLQENSDSTITGAFLDGVFGGLAPSYTTASFGTAGGRVESTDICYVVKISIGKADTDGLYPCTVYYMDVTETGTGDNITYTPVIKKTIVHSKTTMPALA